MVVRNREKEMTNELKSRIRGSVIPAKRSASRNPGRFGGKDLPSQ
jgi:hypothetical protein